MQTETSTSNGGAATALQHLDPGLVEALEAEVVAAQIEPEIDRPAGPAAAVLLATGLASLTLGVLTGLVAAFPGVESALTLSPRVGDLSGVSIVTIGVFFGVWGVMTAVWRRSSPPLRNVAILSAVFFVLCVVATFAPVIHLIENTR
jgi:hypothetical protein